MYTLNSSPIPNLFLFLYSLHLGMAPSSQPPKLKIWLFLLPYILQLQLINHQTPLLSFSRVLLYKYVLVPSAFMTLEMLHHLAKFQITYIPPKLYHHCRYSFCMSIPLHQKVQISKDAFFSFTTLDAQNKACICGTNVPLSQKGQWLKQRPYLHSTIEISNNNIAGLFFTPSQNNFRNNEGKCQSDTHHI